MNDFHESHLIIKSSSYSDDLAKYKIQFKLNFGTNAYEANLNKIKALGVDQADNVFVIAHEFPTEEAAQNAVTKVQSVYENVLSPLVPIPQFWEIVETPKVVGKTFIATYKVPADFAGQLAMLEPMIASLGEITAVDQYLTMEINNSSAFKPILTGSSADSEMSTNASLFKIALVTHKDLPNKVTSLLSGMGAGGNHINTVGAVLSSLRRVHFDVIVDEPTEINKEEVKKNILHWFQDLKTKLSQIDLYGVVKSMGGTLTGAMCISPAVSFELSILAPEFSELLDAAEQANQ